MAKGISKAILAVLTAASEPLSSVEIREACTLELSKEQVSQNLGAMKSQGSIVSIREAHGVVYVLAKGAVLKSILAQTEPTPATASPHKPHEKGKLERQHAQASRASAEHDSPRLARNAAPPPRAAASKKPMLPPVATVAAKRRENFTAAIEREEDVRTALEFNHNTARDTLDVYLLSVADRTIVEPLMAARDQARRALDAYIARGAA